MSAEQHRFFFLLQRASHLLKKEADAALTQAGGLTTAQAAVLSIIAGDGGVSQREIAARLSQRESAISAMATRLIDAGYLKRHRSRDDARVWLLTATSSGLASLERAREPFRHINALIDSCFDKQQMKAAAKGLRQLIEALEAEPENESLDQD